VRIVDQWIPFSDARRAQMADYAQRHYGVASAALTPRVIVVHFTESDTWQSAFATFSVNVANRGELPGTCAHYVLDQSGVAHQLVRTDTMCRHAIGLNHVAIGIEVVQATHGNTSAWAEQQILARPAQAQALVALIRQLQARYGIATTDVIGHAEANRHPLFRDLLGWRNDHTDWSTASMTVLRAKL
jgi:N-acetyl-anhydromuramyl-L-alanine amidase AmpD